MTAARPALVEDGPRLAEAVGLSSVVAVCAHPDDESFGLGGVLDALTGAGTAVAVLSFTHGEASTLRGAPGELGGRPSPAGPGPAGRWRSPPPRGC